MSEYEYIKDIKNIKPEIFQPLEIYLKSIRSSNYKCTITKSNGILEFPKQTKRIVVFGDIHGDFDLILSLCLKAGVINQKMEWIGGDTIVVQMGDILDRGGRPSSIDTNNERLDNHLKSPDFFNATEFPAMSFKSSSSKAIDETTYEVIGEITLHGVSKPLTVRMHKTGESENPRGKLIGFETEFVLTRSEFGMTYGVEGGSLGDETKVIVSLEAGD